ncbi:MAG: hypothetical protein FWG64_04865 [Firmicutes bacterium]|nr:hypothetical protein [Bacillota bacterium]
MKRYYANLLGNWTDITENGTVNHNEDVTKYFDENLTYGEESKIAKCFEFDYINVQYQNKNYRLHPSMIQIVTSKD